MKRFHFLLFVFLLSTFHASAQTHFITAGQTQGMIFTDYVPDINFPSSGNLLQYEYIFDLNHDGICDGKIQFSPYNGSECYDGYTVLIMFQGKVVSFNYSSLWVVSKKFLLHDTMTISTSSQLSNSCYVLYQDCLHPLPHFVPNPPVMYDDTSFSPYSNSYYYFVQTIDGTDTLLGYIHMSYNSLLDYACEGPTSSYIISSTNDLATDKSITTYPNPFTNQINISYPKPFDYQIADYVGRVVFAGKAERTINTGELAAGNYLLVMKNEEMYSVRKILRVE